MISIQPIILAGGTGSRLWPLSRKSYPKQFSKFVGDESLFQQNARRLISSKQINFKTHITVTNSDFRFIVAEQLQAIGSDPGQILLEPEGKNSGPAILAATLLAQSADPEAIVLVAPSDHVIHDLDAFHSAISIGLPEVMLGNIVTLGITPVAPEVGYGYLELSQLAKDAPVKLKSFVEKPDVDTAKKMFDSGNYLWNAGIFLFRVKDMLAAFKKYVPQMVHSVKNAMDKGKADLGFWRIDPIAWSQCDHISIDYAVMEKANNVVAIPFSAGWSDLGQWDAVWKELKPDKSGVVEAGRATAIECQNVLLFSESSDQELVGLGLDNIIAVAMPDAVLVVDKSRVQDVKKIVSILKEKKIEQAENFPKYHRPWGWFETLAVVDSQFRVKRIYVNPKAALSLQSHKHRSEHWVVAEGTAKVTVGDEVYLVQEGESVHIPLGSIHRLENPLDIKLVVIEVQSGSYLGEDDITRHKDLYSRI